MSLISRVATLDSSPVTSSATEPPQRLVTCDAPGCTVASPLPESGHLPAGWHTLERAAGPGADAPQWHFHGMECLDAFRNLEPRPAVGDLVTPAQLLRDWGYVEGNVKSMWRAVIASAQHALAQIEDTAPEPPAAVGEPTIGTAPNGAAEAGVKVGDFLPPQGDETPLPEAASDPAVEAESEAAAEADAPAGESEEQA